MVEAEIWTIAQTDQGDAVLLRPLDAEVSVPIFIGQFEAQAILFGYGELVIPRPFTHDLLLNVIRRLGFEISRVEVHDLRDGVFYARLLLLGKDYPGQNPLILDARPSDAVALAVRCRCPVFIAQEVVETAGISVDLIIDMAGEDFAGGADPGGLPGSNCSEPRRETLQLKLDQAVAAEDYERAAEIRDTLALLKKKEGKDGS